MLGCWLKMTDDGLSMDGTQHVCNWEGKRSLVSSYFVFIFKGKTLIKLHLMGKECSLQ